MQMQSYYKEAFKTWSTLDLPVLIYVVKVTIAALMAMSLCMVFNLSMPQTAIFTVYIVMQPQSGMVFSKSFYRFVGTIIGIGVSLFLMGMFAQDRGIFIILAALWIGICTAVGFKYRNFISYGFVLSGYTALLVSLPTIAMPENVFSFAVDRFSEVSIGLLCSSIISEVLFPKQLSSSLAANEKGRFQSILKTLTDGSHIFEEDKNSFHYGKDILGADALRINSSFEGRISKSEKIYFQRLNSEFMHLCTTYFSLKNIIHNLDKEKNKDILISAQKLYKPIENKLKQYSLAEENKSRIITDIKDIKEELYKNIQYQKEQNELSNRIEFNAITRVIERLLNEFIQYASTYFSFDKKEAIKDEKLAPKFSTHTDNVLIFLSIVRGSGTFIVMSLFWILSAWNVAPFAVISAVATTLLLSAAPNPVLAVKNFVQGAVFSFFISGVYDLYIIPNYVIDVQTFCLVLAPLFAFIAWLMTIPSKGIFAFGFTLIFITVCSMNLQYSIDIHTYIDTCIATVIGLSVAGLAFVLINSWSASWNEKRVTKLLSRKIASLTTEKLALQRVKLESTGFDLIQRFSTLGRLNTLSSDKLFKWLLSTLEIGRAILDIRNDLTLFKSKRISTVFQLLEIIKEFFSEQKERENLIEQFENKLQELSFKVYRSANDQRMMQNILFEFNIIHTIMKNRISLPIQGEQG